MKFGVEKKMNSTAVYAVHAEPIGAFNGIFDI
jgi:hypothetical protein